jgi:hypothetical protein
MVSTSLKCADLQAIDQEVIYSGAVHKVGATTPGQGSSLHAHHLSNTIRSCLLCLYSTTICYQLQVAPNMNITDQRGGSPRKNSLSLEQGAEENLPLYEEFQHSEGPNDALPHAKASPLEVSDFLIHLLIDSRGMSTDGARRVAAMWTKGTGHELRAFPPAMYFDIFGKEDGWIVYREVHLVLHKEKSKKLWYKYGACKYQFVRHTHEKSC